MQIPIIQGVFSDMSADFRTAYPINLTAVPKQQGISQGYLCSDEGIVQMATGQGSDRGAIVWNGVCYRVSGTKLVSVSGSGLVTVLGDVGGTGPVSMDYSFDRMAIASGGNLFYWNGSALTQVTDPDLGTVLDVLFVDGYFMTTDGEFLVVTELNDPTSVDPVKYGSSEADPDPVKGMAKLTREVYALNRYTTEVFQNIGGTGFPFQRVDGAQVMRGAIGTHTFCPLAGTLAFLGSGRNEAPGVYLINGGASVPISTREIDTILEGYTESQLADAVVESRVHKKHELLLIHLPDKCLQYDVNASAALETPAWSIKSSSTDGEGQYLAIHAVWAHDKWIVGDPTSDKIGYLTRATDDHWSQPVGWEFSTQCIYNESMGAIFHELELISLPGRTMSGADPVVWTSYSNDGLTWSQEQAAAAGKMGQYENRVWWAHQGMMRQYRIHKFRGADTGPVAFARLEARIEPLGV